MFERLVVAVDQSAASLALVHAIKDMTALGTRDILLLQCVTVNDFTSISLSYMLEYIDRNLKHLKIILTEHGFAVETRIVPGSPRSETYRVAIREGYGAIVVGAQKHAAVEPFFGGLAYDLIHHAPRPVLIVRLKDPAETEHDGYDFGNHVLLPTDFSENAEQAFEQLIKLVKGGVRRVTLLHVQDQSRIGKALQEKLGEYNEIDGNRLDAMKKALEKAAAVEVQTLIRFGSPSVETLRTISELDVSLVIMGSQGRGFVQELFLGSVSSNIARHSEASVLLIPEKKHMAQ
jgi:nucleotide-binding universal stress UspA family protein